MLETIRVSQLARGGSPLGLRPTTYEGRSPSRHPRRENDWGLAALCGKFFIFAESFLSEVLIFFTPSAIILLQRHFHKKPFFPPRRGIFPLQKTNNSEVR
jgi:hypothetical protein